MILAQCSINIGLNEQQLACRMPVLTASQGARGVCWRGPRVSILILPIQMDATDPGRRL